AEMPCRNPFDDRGHLIVIRHEDAADRQDPQRDAAELAERACGPRDISALRIFAMLLGGLDQPREHGRKSLWCCRSTTGHDSPPAARVRRQVGGARGWEKATHDPAPTHTVLRV